MSPVTGDALALAPWRSLGRVQSDFGTRCTGFLLRPDLVLTAAHCLYRPETGRYLPPGAVHFLWRYDRGAYAGAAQAIRFVISPAFDPRHEQRTLGLDRAFLILDHPLGAAHAELPFAAALPPPGSRVFIAGYERGHDEILQAARCRLLKTGLDGGGHRLLLDDCPALPGASGGPVLVESAAGQWGVIGLTVAASGQAPGLTLAEPLTR
ncbi:trypsin-like serine peptidase [Acidisoma sp. C75]